MRPVFHETLLTGTDALSLLFLLYLNPVSYSQLFGLGFMSDISTLSFSKH